MTVALLLGTYKKSILSCKIKPREGSDSVEDIIIPKRVKKAYKKINRTMGLTLLFLSAMFIIEWISPRYQPFNTLRNTTFSQLPLVGPWVTLNLSFLASLSFFYSLLFGFTLLVIPGIYTAQKITEKNISEKKQLRKLKRLHSRMDYVQFAALIGFVYVLFNTFIFSLANVSGDSMNDNFYDQDDVIISHNLEGLAISDVVVVKVAEQFYLKRIVGLPGDQVRIENGDVWVNGTMLDEPYITAETMCYSGNICQANLAFNEYFILGDNRTNSTDSRAIGPVPIEDFYGQVIFILRPFERLGRVSP